MKFHLKADAYFNAENLEDAFKQLKRHFLFLWLHTVQEMDNEDDPQIITSGKIEINPIKE